MTRGPGARVAATLQLLRDVVTELVVALDDRADDETRADVATVADLVITYPFREPIDRPLAWLFAQCTSDWAFILDDDEVPSLELIDALPALCADERIVHYSLPRRWIYPDTSTYLDDVPWRPDYQLRLFRTDPRYVRFSDAHHRPVIADGPGGFVPHPIWHLDAILRTPEQRAAKALRYEQLRPGMRAGGRALNHAFYLPERRRRVPLAPVLPDERARLDAVLEVGRPRAPQRARFLIATRDEIDSRWPASRGPQSGEIEIAEEPTSFATGEGRSLDVLVRNTGSGAWGWGLDAVPAVRAASWWEDEGHARAVWTPLPGPVEPGEAIIVPVHVQAPHRPGRHRLIVGLVHEDVRWLECEARCEIEVRPARPVAFVCADPEDIVQAIALDPDIEPIVLRRSPRASPQGYRETAGLWSYLFDDTPRNRVGFIVAVVARTVLLLVSRRRIHAVVDVLPTCERIVVGRAARPLERRERWTIETTAWCARRLGVAVERLTYDAEN